MNLEIPVVHLNGTSKESLIEGYVNASEAVRAAIVALGEAAPNQRDYYLRPGTFERAEEQHMSRLQRLIDVMQELRELAEGVDQQAGKAH